MPIYALCFFFLCRSPASCLDRRVPVALDLVQMFQGEEQKLSKFDPSLEFFRYRLYVCHCVYTDTNGHPILLTLLIPPVLWCVCFRLPRECRTLGYQHSEWVAVCIYLHGFLLDHMSIRNLELC